MSSDRVPPQGDQSQHMHSSYEFPVAIRGSPHQADDAADGRDQHQDLGQGQAPLSPAASSRSSSPAESVSLSPSSPDAEEASSPQQQHRQHIQIPKIEPLGGPSPAELAKGLDGKYVDEFGNILDWDGTVLGRVEGDLPSMVGRPVTASGEVFDTDGEVAGYVSENYNKPSLKPLGGNLSTDDEGNIYDDNGNVVGKLHGVSGGKDKEDIPPPQQPPPRQQQHHQHQQQSQPQSSNQGNNNGPTCSCGAPRPAPSAPRPDEMYLDVKSTYDGIQLIIKIPTIFNGGTMRPNPENQNDSR